MALSLKALNNTILFHHFILEEVHFLTYNLLSSNIYLLHNFRILFLVDKIVSFS